MSSEIIIYQTEDGVTKIETRLENETIWLTQAQLGDLYKTSRANITMHIRNIFAHGELDEDSVCKKSLHTADDGKDYDTKYYNLDMIISLGYRINSKVATAFRKWATEHIKEYIVKGFTMDDERLKGNGGGNYWKELLGRIRDIRSSEKALYRQVLDLYALAIDYDPHSYESIKFFKIVQNKLHYAAHGQTAAEVIFDRACSDSDFMGLKSFTGNQPTLKDTEIAKNYLDEKELKILGNLVSGYFDLAEAYAEQHEKMTMRDYVTHLNNILTANGNKLLDGAGAVSHQRAIEKAHGEYRKYQIRTLNDVEKAYLGELKSIEKNAKKKRLEFANR